MEMGLKRGTCWVEYSMTSVTSRMEGRGGKMYSFCAMYSLRMSFCKVPESCFQSTPCFSATARYIAQITAAGELMVIDTVTSLSGIPWNRISMSWSEQIETPHLPTSPSDAG